MTPVEKRVNILLHGADEGGPWIVAIEPIEGETVADLMRRTLIQTPGGYELWSYSIEIRLQRPKSEEATP